MAKAKKKAKKAAKKTAAKIERKPSVSIALLSLPLNTIAGLGTLMAGMARHGVFQLLLFLLGLVMGVAGAVISVSAPVAGSTVAVAGGLMMIAAWAWALVSSIILIVKATA